MGSRKVVWILTHFEFMGPPYWLDDLVSGVATTKIGALQQLRALHVDPGTWWGIQPFAVNLIDGSMGPQVFYSRSGRRMKRGYSLKQALTLSRKVRVRNAARGATLQKAKKKKAGRS